jgi:hypothetical protein
MKYSERSLFGTIKIIRLVLQKEINGQEIKARQKNRKRRAEKCAVLWESFQTPRVGLGWDFCCF